MPAENNIIFKKSFQGEIEVCEVTDKNVFNYKYFCKISLLLNYTCFQGGPWCMFTFFYENMNILVLAATFANCNRGTEFVNGQTAAGSKKRYCISRIQSIFNFI